MRFVYLIVPFFLTSCSTDIYMEGQKRVNENIKKSDILYNKASHKYNFKNTNQIQFNDDVYIGITESENSHGDLLPSYLETSRGVVLVSGLPLTLPEIFSLITRSTQIPIANLISESAIATNGTAKTSDVISAQLSQAVGAVAMANKIAEISQNLNDGRRIQVNFTGPLSVFLNQLATHFDLSWKYIEGKIVISNTEVKTFNITTLPMKFSSDNQVT
ncbi:TPA: hypothetical protein J1070_004671, partial [Escherichia coli]|nr:hypothetical protein [Escherichia coli]